MMDDLMQFLRARLDEDDAAVRAASWDEWDGSHWTAHHREQYDGRWAVIDRAGEGVIPTVAPQAADDAGVAQHIARHDPARTLREVEAKRRIVRQAFEHAAKIDGEWGCCHDAEAIEAGLCEKQQPNSLPLLRLLALPYADHPDYRPEWRP